MNELGIITDLLYGDTQEMREEILSLWPEAKLNGVWDDIHDSRLEVALETTRLKWFKFLVRTGLASVSLVFQFGLMGTDKEEHALIEQAMDAEVPGWRQRMKKSSADVQSKE